MDSIRTPALDRRYLSVVGNIAAGVYSIEYNDSTHLEPNSWTRLLQVEVVDSLTEDDYEEGVFGGFYTLTIDPAPTAKEADNRVIADQLAQSLVRVGILEPVLSRETASDIFNISKRDALVLIPDTNALINGSLRWLMQSLSSTNIWILPIVISLTQIQQQHGWLKAWSRKTQSGKLREALRARTLVNASLGLLERCGEKYQVLEVDPQLLRYVRPAGKASSDPDEGDVLEDRLLIEAIHSVFGATRSRTEKRVLTADVLLARVLHAEAIPALLLQTPIIKPEQVISSIRYEPLAKEFQGAPLSLLLWDLAHSFGSVRLSTAGGEEVVKLEVYWPGKTASDWISETLSIVLCDRGAQKQEDVPLGEVGNFSKAPVPEASLLQVLRIGGAVLQGASDIDSIRLYFADEDRPGKEVVRLGLEILVRAGMVGIIEDNVVSTSSLRELDLQLTRGDLDSASSLMEEFGPYGKLLNILREDGLVPVNRPPATIRKKLQNLSMDAFERLARFPVYLGQAWTDGDKIRDGSARPSDDEVIKVFRTVFDDQGHDRLAPLTALIPPIARELRASPWSLRNQLQRIVGQGGLSEFSFEPAVGKKTISRDQVVSGSLRALNVEPVPLDRLLISGRPVFTVERRG